RAKKRLYITSAAERMFQGRTTRNRRSRFTQEIPQTLLEIDDETLRTPGPGEAPPSRNGYNGRGFASAIPKPASAQPVKGEAFTLKAGDRVRHYKFGDGKLLSVQNMGGDHMMEIAFDGGTTKKLMASYIKLEKI
ncbi:MAG: ATP-dependent DNA helicase PcrA, partial [Angelakisella sp.]